MISFEYSKTRKPTFKSYFFYVESGGNFDNIKYRQIYGVQPPRDVCLQIQNVVITLEEGEWIRISHRQM